MTRLEPGGGRGRAGFIRSEIDIDPRAWFLTSHFPGDEVMPGTLMYESCLQTLRIFLMASGWVDEPGETDWQPVPGLSAALKCRGQVTARVRRVAYEVHLRRLEFKAPEGGGEPEPVAVAEAVMLADDRPIVEVRNLNLRLRGSSAARLRRVWSRPRAARREAEADPGSYNKARILALAEGRPSEALGPAYARFDDGAFLARLPRPPYDFLDLVKVVKGRRYEIIPGTEILARYVVEADGWLFGEAGGGRPALPYAVLNEIALQPCGFLASYMGSTLPFDLPMHFRNLGGRATVLAEVAGGEAVDTRAWFTRESRLGEMIIQHYEFECAVGRRMVYQGVTHFGFFSPEALARQAGLANIPADWPARPEAEALAPYPQGPSFPTGKWRLVEKIHLDPRGGPAGLGLAFTVTRVDPQAWFFRAHFYQDPVCPGSLGLESLLQAGKALAAHVFGAEDKKNLSWSAPALNRTHEWLYRGQVTPVKKEMTLSLVTRAVDEARRLLTVDGLLFTDGLPIYKMEGFTIGLNPVRRRLQAPPVNQVRPAPAGGAEAITGEMILNWRKEKNLSQGQLAKLMGVTPIYISLMERGKRNISFLMAEKLGLIFQTAESQAAPEQLDSILAKGTLKSRREGQAAASSLLTPEDLRARRKARGLSQRKLAEAVGVTATLIGLIELGQRGLSLELAKKILAALKE